MKIFIFILFLISAPFTIASTSNVITICWESELKPPFLMHAEGEVKGIAVDLINQFFKINKVEVRHITYPWKRCLLDLERGKIDVVPNASYKYSRTKYAYYSKPIYKTHLSLFYMKNKFPNIHKLTKINQFKPYLVGGINGFNYSFYKDDIDIDTGAHSRKGLIHKLIKNRVDFAIMQREVFFSLYKDNIEYVRDIGHLAAPKMHTKNYHVLVSKKNKNAINILNVINSGLSSLVKNGEYDNIFNKYLLSKN